MSGENSPPRLEADHQDGVAATALEPSGAAQEASVESAKIMLPMSDTPVINRNKEMRRKGNSNRRSSLGSRGRRASSLIESGQSAIPHRDLDPAEFYKHIAAEGLPEPRRMKQLLIWCGERALLEKPPLGTANSGALLGGAYTERATVLSLPITNKRGVDATFSAGHSGSATQRLCFAIRLFRLVQPR